MTTYAGAGKGFKTVGATVSASGDNNLVAAVSGQSVYVLGLHLSGAAAVVAVLQDTGGAVVRSGQMSIAANGEKSLPSSDSHYWAKTAAGTGLDLNLSGAVSVGVTLIYQQF